MSSYLGNIPSNNFVSLKRQVITGNGGATYTLDYSVASVNDVAIFVNNVRQDPASYSISGTALTLGGTISSSDSCYIIFLGQGLQTVTPANNTIVNNMIVDGTIAESKLASGVNTIQEADMWRLTANISANVDPISANLERVDDASFSKIGTGMSVSSGIWSFPSTGIYQVGGVLNCQPGSNDNILIDCQVTTDNGSSYDLVWRNACGGTTNLHRQGSNSTLVDVTDTSNVKVKFVAGSITSPSVILGDTDFNLTTFTFIRLGDT